MMPVMIGQWLAAGQGLEVTVWSCLPVPQPQRRARRSTQRAERRRRPMQWRQWVVVEAVGARGAGMRGWWGGLGGGAAAGGVQARRVRGGPAGRLQCLGMEVLWARARQITCCVCCRPAASWQARAAAATAAVQTPVPLQGVLVTPVVRAVLVTAVQLLPAVVLGPGQLTQIAAAATAAVAPVAQAAAALLAVFLPSKGSCRRGRQGRSGHGSRSGDLPRVIQEGS